MKKGIVISVYAIMFVICLKLSISYFGNEIIIDKYEDGNYDTDTDVLLFANWIQPYLAHYNMGNIHYQNKEYDSAIEEYKVALELEPGEEEECDVRINLALAMIKTLPEDIDTPEKVEAAIELLTEARDVLLEVGCATNNGDGHNETAQKLKDEIDKLIEQLQDGSGEDPNNGGGDDGGDPNNGGGDDGGREDEIIEHYQQGGNDAYTDRVEELGDIDEYYEGTSPDLYGYVW